LDKENNILITRANEEAYLAVLKIAPEAKYNAMGRTITIERETVTPPSSYIAIMQLVLQICMWLKKRMKQLEF